MARWKGPKGKQKHRHPVPRCGGEVITGTPAQDAAMEEFEDEYVDLFNSLRTPAHEHAARKQRQQQSLMMRQQTSQFAAMRESGALSQGMQGGPLGLVSSPAALRQMPRPARGVRPSSGPSSS